MTKTDKVRRYLTTHPDADVEGRQFTVNVGSIVQAVYGQIIKGG